MQNNINNFDFSFKDIVEHAKDVIIVTKADLLDAPGPEIVYVNKAFTELTEYTKEEILGKNPRVLQSVGTDKETTRSIREALDQKTPIRTTIKNYSKSGKDYWLNISILPLTNPEGVVTHFVSIGRDVSEQIQLQHHLEVLSKTDPLTGLLNRRSFDEIIQNEYSRYKRSEAVYSVIMLDIDYFKGINDQYGHPIGDFVLKSTAVLCESNLRAHDTVARVGGEEFCVCLPDTNKQEAYKAAEHLRDIISRASFPTDNGDISITVSIGVSQVKKEDLDHACIFKRADEKLYRAKNQGRDQVIV